MRGHSRTDILTLSNTQAKELAGRFVIIGGTTYYFKGYDEDHPGQPPWRSGAEGKAYPMLRDGRLAGGVLEVLHAADAEAARSHGLADRPADAHLAAPIWRPPRCSGPTPAAACKGRRSTSISPPTWRRPCPARPGWNARRGIASGETTFPRRPPLALRHGPASAPAALEQAELVHGDLSPNNVVIDLNAQPDDPALYLIDFDAFLRRGGRSEPGRHRGRGRHLRHGRLLPAGSRRRRQRGRRFRGALFRPLWPRHVAAGVPADGQRPASRRSAGQLEPRASPAAICRLAGP